MLTSSINVIIYTVINTINVKSGLVFDFQPNKHIITISTFAKSLILYEGIQFKMLTLYNYLFVQAQQHMDQLQMRQNLIPENSNFDPIESVLVTDKIFYKAFLYFKFWNYVNMIYASFKVFAAIYFIVIQPATHLTIYMLILQISSIVQLSICTYTHRASKINQVYYLLAQKLQHLKIWSRNQLSESIIQSSYRCVQVYDFTNQESEQDDKRMKDLATEIKYYMHYLNTFIMHLSHFNFGIYQFVHFWGILLLFIAEFQDKNQENFVILVIFIGTFQYMEFYVMIIFCLVIMPFWLIKKLQNYLVHKYHSYKMEKLLKSQTFDQNLIKGDQECKICLETYQQNDSIIVLKCSQLHNFHAGCFREWAKTSSTCPLCRRNIIDF